MRRRKRWSVDVWRTPDDNEEGECVAYIYEDGRVEFCNPDAKSNAAIREEIAQFIRDQRKRPKWESRRASARGRAINEMAGGIPNEKDYMIVLWCYYFEQSKEIHNLVSEDDFELLCGDGEVMSLSRYINDIKEFTQKTGLPVEISTPEPNGGAAYCGLSVNGESVQGCFVLTSIRDNKNILRSVIGRDNMIKVG